MTSPTVIVPTHNGAARLPRLLESLAAQTAEHQLLIVDNGSRDGSADLVPRLAPAADLLRFDRNEGFTRAVNLAARRAEGDAIVLVNDDCACEPGFVASLAGALEPSRGVVMAAGVLLSARRPDLIDTAGIELDRTLLPFDYLNGEPVGILEEEVAAPIGPSGAACAFDRSAFLDAGGFDEHLFAYWEDIDLVLRLVRAGARCALAKDARGSHHLSATLGSGSPEKNYLTGFGRGYVLRKWSVLPRRLGAVAARDLAICAGQAIFDRNVAGIRGRLDGYRAARAVPSEPYPEIEVRRGSLVRTLSRRLRRRARLGDPTV